MGKYLILGSRNYANRRIVHELEELGHEAAILSPNRLLPFVNDKKRDRIYVASKRDDKPKRIYKKSVSAIIPRIGYDLQFYAKSVEHMNNNIGIPTTATADGLLAAQDKIRTIQLLSQAGIKTPKTFAIKEVHNLKWVVEKLGGFPIVAKLIFGSRGVGVFILTEALSASTGLDAFSSQGHALLLQQFIETAKKDKNKCDYRAVVIDGKVVASIKRNSVGEDFRTNASLKEDCEGVELDDEMQDIAIRAANACGLACAGVDLAVEVETGEIYVYEVNGNFNFKSTEKFSGKNVAKSIVDYVVKSITKEEKIEEKTAEKYPNSAFARNLSNAQFKQHSDPYAFEITDFAGKKDGIPFGDFPKEDEGEDIDEFEAAVFSTAQMSAKATLWDKVNAAEYQPKRTEMPYFLNDPRNAAARRKWEKENLWRMDNNELAAKRAWLDTLTIEQVAAWLEGLSHAEYLYYKDLADEQYNNPRISVYVTKTRFGMTNAEKIDKNNATVRKYHKERFGLDF